MNIRTRILLGLWPVLFLLPLVIALFEYRVQARELRWGERGQVTTLARAFGEMARVDRETMASFERGDTREVPGRVRAVVERERLRRVAGVRLADGTRAFDSDPSRPVPEPPGARLEEVAAGDAVPAVEAATGWTAWAPVRGPHQEPLGIVLVETRSDAPVRRAAARRRALLVTGIPALASLAICIGLAGFVTRHVRRLRVVSDVGLEETSSLTMRLERLQVSSLPEPSPIREVQDLGTALDTMTSVLAESVQKTRRTFVTDEPSDDEVRLPAVFAETLVDTKSATAGEVQAEARRVGVAAGHAVFLETKAGRVRAAVLRLAGNPGLDAQVAAESAVELLRHTEGDAFGATLERLSVLYRLEAAAAAEADAAGGGLAVFRYAGPEGWRSQRGSGTEVLHTFADATARSVELYLAAYGSTRSETLADELVALADGWDEGVLVVLGPGDAGESQRPRSGAQGDGRAS